MIDCVHCHKDPLSLGHRQHLYCLWSLLILWAFSLFPNSFFRFYHLIFFFLCFHSCYGVCELSVWLGDPQGTVEDLRACLLRRADLTPLAVKALHSLRWSLQFNPAHLTRAKLWLMHTGKQCCKASGAEIIWRFRSRNDLFCKYWQNQSPIGVCQEE